MESNSQKQSNSTVALLKVYQEMLKAASNEVEYMDLVLGASIFHNLIIEQFKQDLLKDLPIEKSALVLKQLEQQALQVSNETVENYARQVVWN